MNHMLDVSFQRSCLPKLFRPEKGRTADQTKVQLRWPVSRAPKINIDKIRLKPLPRSMNRYSLEEYVAECRCSGELRLDKFACAAILADKEVLGSIVTAHGPVENYVRIVFDGTIWSGKRCPDFAAIACIDSNYSPDLYPLEYFDQVTVLRAVLVS